MRAAIDELRACGYQVEADGESIRFAYTGQGEPSVEQAAPLLQRLRASKAEALEILRSELLSLPIPPILTAHLHTPIPNERFSCSEHENQGCAVGCAVPLLPLPPLHTPAVTADTSIPGDYRFRPGPILPGRSHAG